MRTRDLVLKNGRIIDGAGNPWFHGDVAIEGKTIAALGEQLDVKANKEIDVDGKIVCPGFIDVHTHSDISYLMDNAALGKLTQGVTTEIIGNCGASYALANDKGKQFSAESLKKYGLKWDWDSIADYLKTLANKGIPVNIGAMIGLSTIRASVLGFDDRLPSDAELNEMKTMVDQGMRDGAFGVSVGLKYAPGCYSETEELIELCRVAHRHGGLYAAHIRNQGDELFESIDESRRIAVESGIPIHIAHLKVKGRRNWGKAKALLAKFDQFRSEGIDITFDQYPYPAASCDAFAFLPKWVREGGVEKAVERLANPNQRDRIESDLPNQEDWAAAEKILIAEFPPDHSLEGKSVDEIASARSLKRESAFCDLLLAANGRFPVVFFLCDEADIVDIMTHPLMMLGSDGRAFSPEGVLGAGKPHPRNYAAFTRFLRKYVLDDGLLPLEDAIRRMTSYPAQRFGIWDRGLLREGMKADVLVIDESTLGDHATYDDPHQLSTGVDLVVVNGSIVSRNNQFQGVFPGETLRRKA